MKKLPQGSIKPSLNRRDKLYFVLSWPYLSLLWNVQSHTRKSVEIAFVLFQSVKKNN